MHYSGLLAVIIGFFSCLSISTIEANPIAESGPNSATTGIPEHHLKQWDGGCNNDCSQDPQQYCEGARCHNCGLFCDKSYHQHDKAKCLQFCPALYDKLYPPTTDTPPVITTPALEQSTPGQSTQSSSTRNQSTQPSTTVDIDISHSLQSSPKSNTQQQNWIYLNWRWLVGAIMVFLVTLAIFIIFLVKYFLKTHKAEPTVVEQPEADPENERAPWILNGQRPPPPAAVQQDQDASGLPLMGRDPSLDRCYSRATESSLL